MASASLAATASAAERIALVIGSGAYREVPELANPVRDAEAIATALERLGYETYKATDAPGSELDRTVERFVSAAARAKTAVFFYAGHGVQIAGENYLIPVDARVTTERDVAGQSIALNPLLESVAANPLTFVVFLDACRDNPFYTRLATTGPDAGTRGLAEVALSSSATRHSMRKGVGVHIAFATAPGATALDGTGRNSPFTTALLKYMEVPGLEIGRMLRLVRKDVVVTTNGTQRPWDQSSLLDDFYLSDPRHAARSTPAQAAEDTRLLGEPVGNGERRLRGFEIKDLLIDSELTGRGASGNPFRIQISASGQLNLIAHHGRQFPGTWYIDGDRYCRRFAPGTIVQRGVDRSFSCQEVRWTRRGLAFIHQDGQTSSVVDLESIRDLD